MSPVLFGAGDFSSLMARSTIVILLILCAVLFSAFNPFEDGKANEIISSWYGESYHDFKVELDKFKEVCKSSSVEEMQKAYIDLRQAYKKMDFLLIYLHRYEVETFINGAPLPKLAIDTDNPEVLNPKGLQVIDEAMIEADVNRKEIIYQTELLKKKFDAMSGFNSSFMLTNRQIFEAMKLGMASISTLGISGFETPATNLGIEDSKQSLSSIRWCFEKYEMSLTELQFDELEEVFYLFDAADEFLKEADFNSFDRFTLSSEYLVPISSIIHRSQVKLGIEFRDEVEDLPVAVNYRSENIYAANFLNDDYFIHSGGRENIEVIRDLGRTLFFDPILSSNNERSCASCHNPDKAFSEEKAKSLSFDGKTELGRNAMTLTNSVYAEHFFYDFRAGNLRTQFEHVFVNDGEFNTTYQEVAQKLNSCDEYRTAFSEAFKKKSKTITKEEINIALSVYVSSLNGHNSEFDQMIRGEKEANIDVAAGFNLFMGKGKCGTCHFPPTFAGLRPPYYEESESEIIGVTKTEDLDHPELDEDMGRMNSGRPIDRFDIYDHSFKTVSVRNSELSAPYFHNGAFTSLEKVVEFYNRGGGAGLGLELPNQTLPFDSLSLTDKESTQIITFLHALTDIEGLTDKPESLPTCGAQALSDRSVGGKY